MKLVLLMLSALSVILTDGADQTTPLEVTQQSGNDYKVKACFPLDYNTIGWEVVFQFNSGVNNVQQYAGNWVEQHAAGQCATEWSLVNKEYVGKQSAGSNLCVDVTATACGGGELGGTAILKDLTHDGQQEPVAPQVTGADPMKYNYAEVLQKSILFYEAQRSGKLPADNRIPWRGDSALQDHGDEGQDLTGGWYDAGDNVKFNFPMAWSTTVLCWSLLEFPEAYEQAGQLDYMYDCIRWPLTYFVKCHTAENELYIQVGDGGQDHSTWTSPERMNQNRPAYKITPSKPGSDVAGETAAAMACGSIAFKEKDPQFAATLLTHAKQLYTFAKTSHGLYSTSVDAAAAYYKSSNYTDELSWAALWLNKATGDNSYLADAETTYIPGAGWGFAWEEKLDGNKLLFYDATQDEKYKNDIKATFSDWFPGGSVPYTPKCLAWRLQWGALRYSANEAFIALLAAKRGIMPSEYRQWAMCQIHYALGDTGRSFVVGFGTNPPTRPHHRAASCPLNPAPCTWDSQENPGPDPHVLYGALVGGPGEDDDYVDDRKDYVHNEVACDYNAGFQGAVAGLLQLALDHELPDPTQCGKC